MDQKKIGAFLKQLRNEKGLTQEQLAENFHVSTRTISRWETGSNMPDVSMLVEIAEFYDVDVREIIEGERKNEKMDEELKNMANRVADYAGAEKSKLLKWVRVISFFGVALMTLAIILQCIRYEPDLIASGAIVASFEALLAMAITTLYTNGILGKLVQKKGFVRGIQVATILLLVLSLRFMFNVILVVGVALLDYVQPFHKIVGIENYDKQALIEAYSGDMDSVFMTFPDTTERMQNAEFVSCVKTGLFDSDGYFFLKADYDEETFESEVQRLSGITCEMEYRGEKVVKEIKYDESTYQYPAYIASDGYDYVYEYALIDDENQSVVYVLLSYPNYIELVQYRDYLKKNPKEYVLENGKVLENFTIYAHKFAGTDWWTEITDGMETIN